MIYVICGAIAVIASTTYMTTMLHSLTHSDMLDSNRCSWSQTMAFFDDGDGGRGDGQLFSHAKQLFLQQT